MKEKVETKKDCHRSDLLDSYIGLHVNVVLFDDTILTGQLNKYENGRYYLVEFTSFQYWSLRKSHIKSIRGAA